MFALEKKVELLYDLIKDPNYALQKEPTASGIVPNEVQWAILNTILDINHAIHGNYSKDNASVYDGALIFDSALVFKKWMPYMVRNRFMASRYNYRTGKTDEGFYRGGTRAITKTFNNMFSTFENSSDSLSKLKAVEPIQIVLLVAGTSALSIAVIASAI